MLTSLQCGRQIAQLKEEYEETKKILEAEATKLRQVGSKRVELPSKKARPQEAGYVLTALVLSLQNVLNGLKDAEAGRRAGMAAERHTVAANRRGGPDLKGAADVPSAGRPEDKRPHSNRKIDPLFSSLLQTR